MTKAKIGEALDGAVSPQAAERITDLKTGELVEAAETLLAGRVGRQPPGAGGEVFEAMARGTDVGSEPEATVTAAA